MALTLTGTNQPTGEASQSSYAQASVAVGPSPVVQQVWDTTDFQVCLYFIPGNSGCAVAAYQSDTLFLYGAGFGIVGNLVNFTNQSGGNVWLWATTFSRGALSIALNCQLAPGLWNLSVYNPSNDSVGSPTLTISVVGGIFPGPPAGPACN